MKKIKKIKIKINGKLSSIEDNLSLFTFYLKKSRNIIENCKDH